MQSGYKSERPQRSVKVACVLSDFLRGAIAWPIPRRRRGAWWWSPAEAGSPRGRKCRGRTGAAGRAVPAAGAVCAAADGEDALNGARILIVDDDARKPL